MKKIFFTLGLMVFSLSVFSQEAMNKAMNSVTRSRDFLVISLTYDGWANKPDSVGTGLNRGFNIAFMYDFPINKTNLSLAAGLGIGTSGVFLKNHVLNMDDATTDVAKFSTDNTFKKYKVATTYLEIPLELRYRSVPDNANKGFKVALGVKIGNLMNAHTKERNSIGGTRNTEKIANKRFFNSWRYAATARIGLGNLALFGSYNLNPLFKDNGSNLDIRPYSIGIAISGL
ncbi:porin family protein [Chitinophaga sp. GbtcB8]|uniref:porin family protein n=1 Tax=Chitinophaga sp. GbtcB8 TaxID=2824753 RepID=UPI001C2F50B9|nr:porin family protein [Chitinophaga sp. GbtcB8]